MKSINQQAKSPLRFAVIAAAAMCLCSTAFAGEIIYNSIPSPQPSNVPSLGYEANQVNEFGGEITFAGGARHLTSVSVLMSSWAKESTYGTGGTGFSVPLTMNLYNIGPANTVGSQIATETMTTVAPWRPEADSTCTDATQWRDATGNCFNGLAFKVTFDFTGTDVPDSLIYGLSFNTLSAGYTPNGQAGGFNSLNFGLSTLPAFPGSATIPGTAFSSYGATTGMTLEAGWSPYIGAAQFEAVPEPASIALLGLGLAGLGLSRRKRSS